VRKSFAGDLLDEFPPAFGRQFEVVRGIDVIHRNQLFLQSPWRELPSQEEFDTFILGVLPSFYVRHFNDIVLSIIQLFDRKISI
jgi:hypothetical protein